MSAQVASSSSRGLAAIFGIAVIAMLPLLALVLPVAPLQARPDGTTYAARLIVLLPAEADSLPRAAVMLDRADARPLGQGAWANLWLVASADPRAVSNLYAAGAHLVLAGDELLAGCLGFRTAATRS